MISVIIPTYKSPDTLELCLRSAIEGQVDTNQIIVVVDGFYDLNKNVIDKYVNYIDVLNLEQNMGLCRATNLGVYNAKYERILVVNDDNVFPYHWDIVLNESYEPNSVISPNQIEPHPSMFAQFLIKNFGTTTDSFDLSVFWEYTKTVKMNKDDSGSTLPFFMNKIDFLRVGGWDENYERGMVADWDFFLKCKLSGLKMLREYGAPFYHFTSVSVNGIDRQTSEIRGHQYALYKWGYPIQHNSSDNSKFI